MELKKNSLQWSENRCGTALALSPPSDVKWIPASSSHPGWATFLLGTVTKMGHLTHAGWMTKRVGKDSPAHPCGSDSHMAKAFSTKKSNGWGWHSSKTLTLGRNPKARGQCQESRGGKEPRVWFCQLITLTLHVPLGPSGERAAAGGGRASGRQIGLSVRWAFC